MSLSRILVAAFVLLLPACENGSKINQPSEDGDTLPPINQGPGDVSVNASVRHQTIVGWEAHSQSGQDHPNFSRWRDRLFDEAVAAGINRLRLEPRPSMEHTRDLDAEFMSGALTEAQYNCIRFSTVNDNADPFTINWAGMKFSRLDRFIEGIVIPLRQRLAARGESLYLVGTYVAFGVPCAGADYHHDTPEEYAEFVLAVHIHMRDKYGFVPDAWEVILEPNNTQFWRGQQIGQAMVAAGNRLAQHGFTPRFIAPSNSSLSSAIAYYDDMIKVPGATRYLTEFAYHRYGGTTETNLRAIASRAAALNIRTSMLEHIGSGHEDLHQDLKVANVSAWQQFTLGYWGGNDSGGAYFSVDTNTGAVQMGSRTRFLRQYFRYIRSGAVRIDAQSAKSELDPVAFINTNNAYVVVVKTTGAANFTVGGLPAGTYSQTYTTSSASLVAGPDVTVRAGEVLPASIPAEGVVTIFRK